MPPFDTRTIEHGAVRGGHAHHLALENAAVFERQVKHFAWRRIGHRIELHDHLTREVLHDITHAAETPMTTVQTPDSAKRPLAKHFGH